MKKRRILLYILLALALVFTAGIFYEVRTDGDEARVFLESMIARRVEIGEASFNFLGWVTLRDVRIYNADGYSSELLLHAPKVRLTMGMTGGERSAFRPSRVRFDEPKIFFERPPNGRWNTDKLFVEKPPRSDHPTFNLPIDIRGAEISIRDSQVGASGFSMTLPNVNLDHTVISDGVEITNSTLAKNVRMPGGGRFNFELRTRPNARQARALVTLDKVNVGSFKPYYEFIKILTFEKGEASGTYQIDFDSGTARSDVVLDVKKATARHLPTDRVFEDVATTITYKNMLTDTRVELTNLKFRWFESEITGGGTFSTRRAPDSYAALEFRADDARAEDLSFLLCDPAFQAEGPIDGSAVFTDDAYEIDVELNRASTRYGTVFRKTAGVNGTMKVLGRTGRVERIDLAVSRSTGRFVPRGEGLWRLELPELYGADVATHLTAFARLKDFSLSGPISASFDLAPRGSIKGRIDFTRAAADLKNIFRKEAGERATVDIGGKFSADRVEAKNWMVTLGNSRITLDGQWTPSTANLDVGIVDIGWNDAKKYMPAFFERIAGKLQLDGSVKGKINLDMKVAGEKTLFAVDGTLDLGASNIEIVHVGEKARGLPAGVTVKGTLVDERLKVASGSIWFLGTRLGLSGELGFESYDIAMSADAAELDGLKTLLASQLFGVLRGLETRGPGDIDITLVSRGAEVRLAAELNAPRAALSFGDTWYKPSGEAFKVRSQITQSPAGTVVERIELTQGTSTVLCDGVIGPGRPALLSANLRANLDVPKFIERTPGLARTTVAGRKASNALQLIADPDNRAALSWKLSGSIEEPELALMMDQLVTRAAVNSITKQLKGITRLISAPLWLGTGIIEGVLNGGSRAEE